MGAMVCQITSPTIIYSTVYSGADQRKHQSYTSLAFVREIHRWPVNSPHKWPVTRKMFPFDDVITHIKMLFYGTCLGIPWGTSDDIVHISTVGHIDQWIHLRPQQMADILQTGFSNTFWWKRIFVFWFKFYRNCPSETNTCQHWKKSVVFYRILTSPRVHQGYVGINYVFDFCVVCLISVCMYVCMYYRLCVCWYL